MKKNERAVFLFIMILAMLIWGGSWVSGKIIAPMTSPDTLVFWRYFLTAASFLLLLPLIRKDLKVSMRSLASTALCGVLLVIYNQLFFTGLKYGGAGSGGVIVTTLSPLLTFALGGILYGKKFNFRQSAGLAVGLASGLVLIEVWHLSYGRLVSSGNLFFILNALIWALITILSQRIQKRISAIGYSFYVYLFAALIQLPFCDMHALRSVFSAGSVFWINMIYLSAFSSTFAGTVYFLASKKIGAERASSFMFIVPLSALLFSARILDEKPSVYTVAGGCAAIAAVYLINRKDRAVN